MRTDLRPVILLLCLAATAAPAESIGQRLRELVSSPGGAVGQPDILEPGQAFQLSATPRPPAAVRFTWVVADGYYLYRDKFSFASLAAAAVVDESGIHIPRGTVKRDESFGEAEVNTGLVVIDVPLVRVGAASPARAPASLTPLQVTYQGCKEGSVCYPPITRQVEVSLAPAAALPPARAALSAQDRITKKLERGGLVLNVPAFFVFGFLLSLTPCVFPMIPILSGVIVGQSGVVTRRRGLLLSGAYVLALALTYSLLGMLAGGLRFNLQAASQNAWVLGAFSLAFVLLALSMFGLYELRLPAAWQTRLAALSQPRPGGGLRGAAFMGAVSAVIVGPCVAPPLAGALLYISQTGDAALGGAVLFAMGLGFGAPLLLLGASAGALLPRAGPWMERIKQAFGFIMLGVAAWFLGRVLPDAAALSLWALLALGAALFLGALGGGPVAGFSRPWWARGAGVVLLCYGVALLAGAATGADDVLRPLQRVLGGHAETRAAHLEFERIKSAADLEEKLAAAGDQGKYVMLDFYADWCVTCLEMEDSTFSDPRVQQALADVVLLQADVTAYDAADQRLLEGLRLFGPPALLFFDPAQRELEAYRLVGYIEPEPLLRHLAAALAQ